MEQTSRLHSAPTQDTLDPATESVTPEGALRDELAKWRERVPKLAAALRQRGEEAEALKRELERLRELQGEAGVSAGVRARDELIAELEQKLAELSERHTGTLGELHGRQLEVAELKDDVQAWKAKWQALTRSLDEQADGQRALREAQEERDSLRRRNEQLFETTELANRQIGSLSESLAELRESVQEHRRREAELTAAGEARARESDALQARIAELEAAARDHGAALAAAREAADAGQERLRTLQVRADEARASAERAEQDIVALTEELHLQSQAAAASMRAGAEAQACIADAQHRQRAAEQRLSEVDARGASLQTALDEQRAEVARLTQVVAVAQRITRERELERRSLSERIQDLESRNGHLEQQLGERSQLVLTLEEDLAAAQAGGSGLQQERDRLEEALIRAERHAQENAEHVTQLDAKLERQKELLESLEQELAEAREEQARSRQAARAGEGAEIQRLKAQLHKLEGVLRERTDEIDRLSDAQAQNESLMVRLQELERAAGAGARSGDDLTRIHGIGQKLAEQLNELGFHRYAQIAELDEAALADSGHALHGHRGRILRDRWIDQAVRLISH